MKKIQEIKEASLSLPDVRYGIDKQLRLIYAGTALMGLFNLLTLALLDVEVLTYFYAVYIVFFALGAKAARVTNFARIYSLSLFMIILQALMSTRFLGDACAIPVYLLSMLLVSNYVHATAHSRAFRVLFIGAVTVAGLIAYLIIDDFIDFFVRPHLCITQTAKIFFTILNASCSFALFIFICSVFALSFQQQVRLLNQRNSNLKNAASTDSLTGLLNRTGFYSRCERMLPDLRKSGSLPCVAMLDIDYFKSINDGYGHEGGDLVLRRLSAVLRTFSTDFILIARWGGEEFLLLLPGDLTKAGALLEELRAEIEKQEISFYHHTLKFTISAGIAKVHADETLTEAVRRADLGLYQAKENGRNQVRTVS